MRLRDNLDQYDPKRVKKNGIKKPKEPPKREEEKPQTPEKKKEIKQIITKEDVEKEFRRWKPDCNCDAKLLYKKEKPGGNWVFYKQCSACGSKSTALYRVRSNIDEFLQSDRGQLWKDEKEG